MLNSSVENESLYDLVLIKAYFWVLLEIFEDLRGRDLGYWNVVCLFFFFFKIQEVYMCGLMKITLVIYINNQKGQ